MPDERQLNLNLKKLVDGLRANFDKIGSTVGKHVNEVMTEEMSEVKETIKDTARQTYEVGKNTLNFLGETFKWDKLVMGKEEHKQTSELKGIHKIMKWWQKSEMKKFALKGKNLLAQLFDLLGLPLLLAGAAIGAIIGQILLPFKLLAKTIKPFLDIVKGFGKLGIMRLASRFPRIARIFTSMGKFFRWFSRLPGIRMLFRGLKFGFKKLLWPLQILFSLIDFIEGFMTTKGSMYEKIKGGLKNVVMKFFDFPMKLLGGAWDWLMEKLGLRKEGDTPSAAVLSEKLGWLIDKFFGFWETIGGWVWSGIEWLLEKLEALDIEAAWNTAKDWYDKIRNLPGKLLEWWGDMIDSFFEWIDKKKEELKAMPGQIWAKSGGWLINKIFGKEEKPIVEPVPMETKQGKAELDRLAEQYKMNNDKSTEKVVDAVKNVTKAIKEQPPVAVPVQQQSRNVKDMFDPVVDDRNISHKPQSGAGGGY